jgi:hypothetical protein
VVGPAFARPIGAGAVGDTAAFVPSRAAFGPGLAFGFAFGNASPGVAAFRFDRVGPAVLEGPGLFQVKRVFLVRVRASDWEPHLRVAVHHRLLIHPSSLLLGLIVTYGEQRFKAPKHIMYEHDASVP